MNLLYFVRMNRATFSVTKNLITNFAAFNISIDTAPF